MNWSRRAIAPRVSDRTGECDVYFDEIMVNGEIFIRILFHESPAWAQGEGTFTRKWIWLRDLAPALAKALADGTPFDSSIFKSILPANKNNSALVVAILRHMGILTRIGPPGSYLSEVAKSVDAYHQEECEKYLNLIRERAAA